MKFTDRADELGRLNQLASRDEGGLAVVWGRRRIGKTRMLLEWTRRHDGLYTVCDRSASSIQRRYLAQEIGRRLAGFDEVVYPDWKTLLNRLGRAMESARWRGPLVLDEFPYAVESEPALASVLQNWIDHEAGPKRLTIAISGSSQRMMQGFALDGSAPLYGRAAVQLHLQPLKAGYLGQAIGVPTARKAVEAYAVWGGVPRYWELAAEFGDELDRAVDRCVLDPLSPLHTEPDRLLLEESPPAGSLRAILDAIGGGCNRITEIGARLGQQATSLARPLSRLIELGLVQREVPHGVSEKTSKRALYKTCDPFFRLWFRVVAPNRGLLAQSPVAVRTSLWKKAQAALTAEAWEDLCRQCIALMGSSDTPLARHGPWAVARRYWRGNNPEWDVVALSLDGSRLLLGEAKWNAGPTSQKAIEAAGRELMAKGVPDIHAGEKLQVVRVLFLPELGKGLESPPGMNLIDARTVLGCLR